jgi:sugar (pentulose or hexulose) kinase
MLAAFHDAGVESTRVVAIGGGTKGGLWTQIVSDVTGITQELSNERIGASYGDALFAGRAAGLVGDYDDWEEVADTVTPNPANREVYEPALRGVPAALPGNQGAGPHAGRVAARGGRHSGGLTTECPAHSANLVAARRR